MTIEPMTPTSQPQGKGIGCFQIFLFLVFLLGAFLMFSKTSDLMAAFAPKKFFGYTDFEIVYGILCAMLLEGTIAAMKAKMLFSDHAQSRIEWAWDIVLTTFPFVISALAQVFDGFLVRQTLSSQPAWIQVLLDWGVPLIPPLVVGCILVYGFIISAPPGLFDGVAPPGRGRRISTGWWTRLLDRVLPAQNPT